LSVHEARRNPYGPDGAPDGWPRARVAKPFIFSDLEKALASMLGG
jgi:hypothetical protein